MIPEAAVKAGAKAIYGNRVREWTLMEELACTSQARRAIEAAAPYILGGKA